MLGHTVFFLCLLCVEYMELVLGKLVVAQPAKKFAAFYGTVSFIGVFTRT